MRDRFIQTLSELAARDPRIMLITGDLGFKVFDDYRLRFPRQFINAGVAEQNMTLVATGLALEGHVVFTYSIGNFPTLRALEMIRNDAAYHGANVKVVSIGGGFSYGALGISHHATEDLAIMRALPDVVTVSPTSLWEVAAATRAIVATPGTCFLRLDKDNEGPAGDTAAGFTLGRPRQLRQGADVAFVVTGGILSEVARASDRLAEQGIAASIYSVHTLKPLEASTLVAAARAHRAVVTVEEHTIHGGLGGAVLEAFGDANVFPERFLRIGLEGCFSSVVGSQTFLRGHYGLDSAAIARRTHQLLTAPPHVKRVFDFLVALAGLAVLWPFLLLFMLLIWLQDFCSPFYVAARARSADRTFNMIKLRSMVKNADRKGGASTAANDRRITWVGRLIRKTKFDEVPQLWNVLKGDMSLVGPRPQVMRDVRELYTAEERNLFAARPGITDFASIVFADEGEILRGSANPDLRYNQVIRPWKSRLGLFYTRHQRVGVDIQLIGLTLCSAVSRPRALRGVQGLLTRLGADSELVHIAGRQAELYACPPPGATVIETRC